MHINTLTTLAITCASAVLAAPAKVVSYSTSCTGTLASPTPQQYICGQVGRLTAQDGYLYTSSNDASTTAEECYENCVSMAGKEGPCRTFAFNSAKGTCMYFSKSIKSQDFVADGTTGEMYYNNHCWKNHCTTSYFSTATPAPTSSKTSPVKSTKTASAKPVKTTSTKATSTKAPSTKATSTKATSTKVTSTEASTTKSPKTKSTKSAGATTTSTSASSPAATCTVPNLSIDSCETSKVNLLSGLDVLTYTSYFSGTHLTENPNNPSNPVDGALLHTTTLFPASESACQAVSSCANQASLLGVSDLALSFDLHFVDGSDGTGCSWECVTYALANTDTSVFNVKNESVKAVFGYSGSLLTGVV